MRLTDPELTVESGRDSLFHAQTYVADSYYMLEVKSHYLGGSSTSTSIDTFRTRQFAAGADQIGRASLAKPQYWINGTVKLTVYYAGDAADAGNFNIQVDVDALDLGVATGSADSILTDTSNHVGHATAKILQSFSLESSTAIDADHDVLSLYIKRNGSSDANSGNWHFIRATVEYRPANRQ
jgi:hypothetical protein